MDCHLQTWRYAFRLMKMTWQYTSVVPGPYKMEVKDRNLVPWPSTHNSKQKSRSWRPTTNILFWPPCFPAVINAHITRECGHTHTHTHERERQRKWYRETETEKDTDPPTCIKNLLYYSGILLKFSLSAQISTGMWLKWHNKKLNLSHFFKWKHNSLNLMT